MLGDESDADLGRVAPADRDPAETPIPTEFTSASVTAPTTGETLAELIARLESNSSPNDEDFFHEPISALSRALHARGEVVPQELMAEEIAFSVHAHDHQEASSWGLYFGPFMSWSTTSGELVDSPPLTVMTMDVLSYWQQRASESVHPVMRARYADLLWEMPKRLEGARPDAAMARVAIDAYLEAVEANMYEHEVSAVDKAKRALDIALSLSDGARIERARDVLIVLEDQVAEDESLGLWGFCFETLLEPPNRRVPVSDTIRSKIVSDLEARLSRLAIKPCDGYHPVGAEAAALRLAKYYRRRGQQADVVRVLRTYGEAAKRMRGTAPAMLVAHSLEQLYDQYTAFGLHDDADALNEALRVANEESLRDMKEISTAVEVPRDELDAYFAAMLAGSVQEVLGRLAGHFVPRRDELEAQMRDLAKKAPLSYMMARSIKDDDGRTVAHVGPLESDLEGQLLSHISQNMQLAVPWLREAVRRGFERSTLSAETLLEFVLACPLFPAKRSPMLELGLSAYFRDDSITAIHVLVPQIEQAIRQLAILVGAPIYGPRRGGGLHTRTLDDLLRDEAILSALGENIVTYFRVLLTDARGWNVRNSVCHGFAPVSFLSMPVADRVVHAILVLGLVRQQEAEQQGQSEEQGEHNQEPSA